MSRPAFRLTDDQARHIAQQVAAIDLAIPLDTGNHRPFVSAFIKAVHQATGKFFSPNIYHRLLRAYAPARRPSTATLASERTRIMDDMAVLDAADASGDMQRERLAQAVRGAIADELDLRLAALPRTDGAAGNAEQQFYKHRLEDAERELRELRAKAAQLVTELAVATQRADMLQKDLDAQRDSNSKLGDQVRSFQSSVDEHRKFALMSIEDARGEVRHWKERCADLELQRQRDYQLVDALRRLVSKQDETTAKGPQ